MKKKDSKSYKRRWWLYTRTKFSNSLAASREIGSPQTTGLPCASGNMLWLGRENFQGIFPP
jgi:hypothetical protein